MQKRLWFLVILLISIFILLFNSVTYAITLAELKSMSSNADKITLYLYLEDGVDYSIISPANLNGEDYEVLAVINGGKYIIVVIDGKIHIVQV